mmetsp:Transcript_13959/g.21763  ORF Transcript_13959/g.21763 Transcript_13959/m.21763 type:complete len:88 (+) Transcript_13959:1209-1472(+)
MLQLIGALVDIGNRGSLALHDVNSWVIFMGLRVFLCGTDPRQLLFDALLLSLYNLILDHVLQAEIAVELVLVVGGMLCLLESPSGEL